MADTPAGGRHQCFKAKIIIILTVVVIEVVVVLQISEPFFCW